MPEGPRDPRITLIATVIAIGETPQGRALCERFLAEAARLTPANASDEPFPLREVITPAFTDAIRGVAAGLTIAADHAEFVADRAEKLMTPPLRTAP